MGSSDDPNSNEKAIDASVGGLVWVRRRNGSWWPGRIMGLDEVSSEGGGDLVSPRSGTPVKLLGREDASVDWYNLEKSKRVKAFRCGEYDECIEKARVAAANGNKKAVKYARREDAIIHALEIENARLGKDCIDFSKIDNEHTKSAKESQSVSLSEKEDDEDVTDGRSDAGDDDTGTDKSLESESASHSDSAPGLSQGGTSIEESKRAGASKEHALQGKRRRTPNDSEDDGTEGIKRMRGLEDLGMGVGDSNAGSCISNGAPVNLSRSYNNNAMKRKRTQVAYVHELLKRKNRRRPLTKVLESTTMVSVPVLCDQLPSSSVSPRHGLSDSKVTGIESTESGKNVTVFINGNSESTGVSCENGASVSPSYSLCDASHSNGKLKKENDIGANLELVQDDNPDKLFDVPFVREDKQSAGISPVSATSSGKRQIGQGRQVSQSSQAEDASLKNEELVEHSPISSAAAHVNNGSQRLEKGTSKWQLKGKRKSRHKSDNRKHASRKYMSIDDEANGYLAGVGHKVNCEGTRKSLGLYNRNFRGKSKSFAEDPTDGIWEWSKSLSQREPHLRGSVAEASVPPQRSLPYRQSRFTVNSRYQASEFLGKNFGAYSKVFDVKLEVKANYRPQHVPLVSLTSKLNGKAIVGHPLTVEILDDGYCDDIISDEFEATHVENADLGFAAVQNAVNGRATAKHMVIQPRSSPSKSPKLNKGGLLSKKIRKLSSLTGHREENRKPVVEKPKGPVVACIPLKVVFSRINEGVNGSARQSHRALSSSNS